MLIVDADFHKVRKISEQLRYLSFYIDLPYFQRYIKDILNVGLYVNPGYRTQEQIPPLEKNAGAPGADGEGVSRRWGSRSRSSRSLPSVSF